MFDSFAGDLTFVNVFGKKLLFVNKHADAIELLEKRSANFSSRFHSVFTRELYVLSLTPPSGLWYANITTYQVKVGIGCRSSCLTTIAIRNTVPSCIGSHNHLP